MRARHQAGRRDRADQSYRRRIRPAPPVRNLFRAAGAPARLAAGIPLSDARRLGPAPWRSARDRTARHAAARAFFADSFRAPGRWRAPQRGLNGGAMPAIAPPGDPGYDLEFRTKWPFGNGFWSCFA